MPAQLLPLHPAPKASHRLFMAGLLLAPVLSGCTRDYKFQPVDMWNNARLTPQSQVNFFDDKRTERDPPDGTVARGQDRLNEPKFYGTNNGTLIGYNPIWLDAKTSDQRMALLQRGQERYQIYCQPCHGLAGYGDGMIVKRGFSAPPSYHIERLRTAPDGHLYDVITNGHGNMYSYAARVTPRDRWAIVAYIRALQRSQNASASDLAGKPADGKGENAPGPNGETPKLPGGEMVPITPTYGIEPTPLPAVQPLNAQTNLPASEPPQFASQALQKGQPNRLGESGTMGAQQGLPSAAPAKAPSGGTR